MFSFGKSENGNRTIVQMQKELYKHYATANCARWTKDPSRGSNPRP